MKTKEQILIDELLNSFTHNSKLTYKAILNAMEIYAEQFREEKKQKTKLAVIRWKENTRYDIVCQDAKTAIKYMNKYNKTFDEVACFIDDEIFPLKRDEEQD